MKRRHILRIIYWIFTGLLNTSLYSQATHNLLAEGDSLRKIDAYDKAYRAYSVALKKATAIHDSLQTGNIYLRMGILFQRQSINSKALESYFKSLNIFEAIQAKERIATANNNIGIVYKNVDEYEKALIFFKRAYQAWLELKDSSGIPYALNNIGLVFKNQDSTKQAAAYFQTILTRYGKLADTGVLLDAMTNMASLLLSQKQHAKALQYYTNALKLTTAVGDKYKTALALGNISVTHKRLHNYRKALWFQQKALKLATDIGALELTRWIYFNNSEIYSETGQYKKAYTAALKSIELQDSIYSEIKSRYDLAEANYKRGQKEAEIKTLLQERKISDLQGQEKEKNLKNRNRLLVISLFITVLIILVISLLYKFNQIRRTNERIFEKQHTIILEKQLTEWELTALRAQMNPHFIFNALSSIKNYMLEQNVELSNYYLGKFAKLIRLILDNSSQNFVPLEKEIQLLESYIQLEQLRFENKFTYMIKLDEQIDASDMYIPSMIIQPFVENSIIHGFLHKEGNCHLEIDIRHFETYLVVIVKDDGVGRFRAEQLESASFDTSHQPKGYKISEQRLKALSKNSNTKTGIAFTDLEDAKGKTGTLVEINLPLRQETVF